jgi:hypothetical protein
MESIDSRSKRPNRIFQSFTVKSQRYQNISKISNSTRKKCNANSRGMNILQLEKETHDAYVHYKTLRTNHQERRDNFIEELAKAQATAGNKKKAQILKEMIQIEKQRSVFRRIALIAGEKQNLGTNFVEVKDPKGNIEQITDRHQMEVAIINENRKKIPSDQKLLPLPLQTTQITIWELQGRSTIRSSSSRNL